MDLLKNEIRCLRPLASCNSEQCQGLDVFCKNPHAGATLTGDVGASLTRCNECRARRWDRLFLTAKRDNEQLLPHRTDVLSYDDSVFLKDTEHHRNPSLIVGKHIENWGHIVWLGQPGKKWPPPKRLSGCDRAVKAAQLESLSWLVAWLSCFAALQGNLA